MSFTTGLIIYLLALVTSPLLLFVLTQRLFLADFLFFWINYVAYTLFADILLLYGSPMVLCGLFALLCRKASIRMRLHSAA